MNSIYGNPVRRLHLILNKMCHQRDGVHFRDALAKAVGIDAADDGAMLRAHADLHDLVIECESSISRSGLDEAYLVPMPVLFQALIAQPLGGQINGFKSKVTDTILARLELTAIAIQQYVSIDDVPEEKIRALRNEVDGVLKDCLDADLPPELKQMLVQNLQVARSALEGYVLGGIDEMYAAVLRAFGAFVMHQDQMSQYKNNSAVKKAWDFFWRAKDVAAPANHARQLAESAAEAFKLLGN